MRSRWIKAAVVGVCALALGGCDGSNGIFSEMRFINAANAAKKAYPDLSPEDATRRFVIETFNEAYAQAKTPEQQRILAADFYLGFSMLHARAVPAYCKEMNLDLTGFAEEFRAINRNEEYAIDDLLEHKGIARDDVWSRAQSQMMRRAKYELMGLGGLSAGSYGVCSALAKDPGQYAGNADFAALFPDISRVLTSID